MYRSTIQFTMRKQVNIVMNQAVTEMVQTINDSFPSIYTKDDVISVLKKLASNIDEKVKMLPDESSVPNLKAILDVISDTCDSFHVDDYVQVDHDSAEFSLDYNNRVTLDRVDFEMDMTDVYEVIAEALEDKFRVEETITIDTNVETPQ